MSCSPYIVPKDGLDRATSRAGAAARAATLRGERGAGLALRTLFTLALEDDAVAACAG